MPSWIAFSVIRLLEQHFTDYVDYEFTADMEGTWIRSPTARPLGLPGSSTSTTVKIPIRACSAS
ncbi:DNA topoisomerase 1 [Arthrobacter sp. Hiyo4]|nr:DNA topoisomerase 1 [Arthrobacter sp. Hiyo4]